MRGKEVFTLINSQYRPEPAHRLGGDWEVHGRIEVDLSWKLGHLCNFVWVTLPPTPHTEKHFYFFRRCSEKHANLVNWSVHFHPPSFASGGCPLFCSVVVWSQDGFLHSCLGFGPCRHVEKTMLDGSIILLIAGSQLFWTNNIDIINSRVKIQLRLTGKAYCAAVKKRKNISSRFKNLYFNWISAFLRRRASIVTLT